MNAIRLEILALGVAAVTSRCVKGVARIATRAGKNHVVRKILDQDRSNGLVHAQTTDALVVAPRISRGLGAFGVSEAGHIPGCSRGDRGCENDKREMHSVCRWAVEFMIRF